LSSGEVLATRHASAAALQCVDINRAKKSHLPVGLSWIWVESVNWETVKKSENL